MRWDQIRSDDYTGQQPASHSVELKLVCGHVIVIQTSINPISGRSMRDASYPHPCGVTQLSGTAMLVTARPRPRGAKADDRATDRSIGSWCDRSTQTIDKMYNYAFRITTPRISKSIQSHPLSPSPQPLSLTRPHVQASSRTDQQPVDMPKGPRKAGRRSEVWPSSGDGHR